MNEKRCSLQRSSFKAQRSMTHLPAASLSEHFEQPRIDEEDKEEMFDV